MSTAVTLWPAAARAMAVQPAEAMQKMRCFSSAPKVSTSTRGSSYICPNSSCALRVPPSKRPMLHGVEAALSRFASNPDLSCCNHDQRDERQVLNHHASRVWDEPASPNEAAAIHAHQQQNLCESCPSRLPSTQNPQCQPAFCYAQGDKKTVRSGYIPKWNRLYNRPLVRPKPHHFTPKPLINPPTSDGN